MLLHTVSVWHSANSAKLHRTILAQPFNFKLTDTREQKLGFRLSLVLKNDLSVYDIYEEGIIFQVSAHRSENFSLTYATQRSNFCYRSPIVSSLVMNVETSNTRCEHRAYCSRSFAD